MSRLRRWVSVGIGVAVLATAGCGRDESLDRIGKALASCEDRSRCAKAIAELRSLDRERRDSADGVEVRMKALHRSMAALMAFPDADRAFLAEAGLEPERAPALLDEEARSLESLGSRAAGVEDARTVLATMRQPSCERLQGLETVENRGGRFADLALLQRLSTVAQIVASVDPYRVQSNAAAAQLLLGCRLPQDAEDAEILAFARVQLEELLERCPKGAGTVQEVRGSCDRAAELARHPLPLPMPGLSSGELAGAMLPPGRGYGLMFTPPWALVLSAGRLQIIDQPVLKPGARQLPDPVAEVLYDMRRSHTLENLTTALHFAWEKRPAVEYQRRKFIPIAADRSASYSDLMEILEACLAESDALPLLALLPSGARTPEFLPLNYRYSIRPLVDPWGARDRFRKDPPALDLVLTPFHLAIGGVGGGRTVEFLTSSEVEGPRRADLRDVYRAVLDVVGREGQRSAWLTASPTVSVGLLASLLGTLAAQVDPTALASPAIFESAQALRFRDGSPKGLVRLIVLRPSEMAPE